MVVENIHAYLQGRWTPDAFVESHGDEQVSVMDSSVPTTTVMTVAQFFELFTSDLSKQKRVVKMKVCLDVLARAPSDTINLGLAPVG